MPDVLVATRDPAVSDLIVLTFRDVGPWRVRTARPEDVLTDVAVPPRPAMVVIDLSGAPEDEALLIALRRVDRKVTVVGVCPKDRRNLLKHVRIEHEVAALVPLPIEPWSLLDQAFRLAQGTSAPA